MARDSVKSPRAIVAKMSKSRGMTEPPITDRPRPPPSRREVAATYRPPIATPGCLRRQCPPALCLLERHRNGARHGPAADRPRRIHREIRDRGGRRAAGPRLCRVALDWRGQGLSDRPLADHDNGHIDSFEHLPRRSEAVPRDGRGARCRAAGPRPLPFDGRPYPAAPSCRARPRPSGRRDNRLADDRPAARSLPALDPAC